MKKIVISAMLSILLTIIFAGTTSADDKYNDMFYYKIINNEISIISCVSSDLVITIPDTIEELPVTTIYEMAFSECKNVKEIVLPHSVKVIGDMTFIHCSTLEKVNIPQNVNIIPSGCFYGCTSLQEIIIADNITKIGTIAFEGCTNLNTITIPPSLTKIEHDAFKGCTNLDNVYIENIESYLNINCGNREACPMYHATNLYINGEKITDLIVPDTINQIPSYAFYKCNSLKTIKIPDSVTNIGYYAFFDCDELKGVILPDSALNIDDYAFSRCNGLTSLTFPNVIKLGKNCFENCVNLTDVKILGNTKLIEQYAFNNCLKLTNITIPDSVTTIGDNAFFETAFFNDPLNWDNGILYIGNHLIKANNASGDFFVKNGTITIASHAFYECNDITGIIIPNSVKNINNYAFFKCNNLKNIVLGNNIEVILSYTFCNCPLIDSITIPYTVREIKPEAIFGSPSITTIKYYGNEDAFKKISIGILNDNLMNATIYYFPASIKIERTNNNFIVIPTNVPTQSSIIFANYKDDKMVYIETYTYNGEENLTFTSDIECDEVKVFVWSNLKNCIPLCHSKSVYL